MHPVQYRLWCRHHRAVIDRGSSEDIHGVHTTGRHLPKMPTGKIQNPAFLLDAWPTEGVVFCSWPAWSMGQRETRSQSTGMLATWPFWWSWSWSRSDGRIVFLSWRYPKLLQLKREIGNSKVTFLLLQNLNFFLCRSRCPICPPTASVLVTLLPR